VNKKFVYECEIAKRFFDALSISYISLTDPLELFGRETGTDVQVLFSSGKKVGIQVTVFHADEHLAKNSSDECLRSREEKDRSSDVIQTYAIPIDYRPALSERINEKIVKAQSYSFSDFDEVWLLVAASLPQVGAIASTTMLPVFVDPENLNIDCHESLSRSKYSVAFLHIVNEKKTFRWQQLTRWQLVEDRGDNLPLGNETNYVKNCLNNTELKNDPHGWAQREAHKVLEELRQQKIY
jgi:hypothetical protein